MTKRFLTHLAIALVVGSSALPFSTQAQTAEELLVEHYQQSNSEVVRYFQLVEFITSISDRNPNKVRSVLMHDLTGTIIVSFSDGATKQFPASTKVLDELPRSHLAVLIDNLNRKHPDVEFEVHNSNAH